MEKENTFKITLADGTVFEGLRLNGNNYISEEKIEEEVFTEEALREVRIHDGETESVIYSAVLIQLKKYGEEYWFILAEKSPEQMEKEQLEEKADRVKAVTDYNIMMGNLEDPEDDEEGEE